MIELHRGDCIRWIRAHPDLIFGAVVTDPPYDIGLPGGDLRFAPGSAGISFDPVLWGLVYERLRPGGLVKVFGASRTFHRLCRVLEEAGFVGVGVCLEAWVYSKGFPRGVDITKAIDQELGVFDQRKVVGINPSSRPNSKRKGGGGFDIHHPRVSTESAGFQALTRPASPEALAFEGYNTMLKPAWEPIVVGYKPCRVNHKEANL